MYEIFISTVANKFLTVAEIKQAVIQLSARNISKNVTGILIYNEGAFYQILEGDKNVLLDLMETVKEDDRHGTVHTIWEGEIPKRGYKKWGLAPCMISKIGLDSIYAEKADNVSTSQRLLETLAKSSGFQYSSSH